MSSLHVGLKEIQSSSRILYSQVRNNQEQLKSQSKYRLLFDPRDRAFHVL